MKYAIDKQSPQNLVVRFFFHARGIDMQKTPLGLYRSLLHQLLWEIPSLRPDFRAVYRTKNQTYEE
jgi:hypothetical protein